MLRPLVSLVFLAVFSGAAFGQAATAPSPDAPSPIAPAMFRVADVHTSLNSKYPFMTGPDAHGDRYTVRDASMIDLINTAYGVDPDNILGGPAWLEMDRFDVIAKMPVGASPDAQKQMLQSLLADRFKLIVHKDTRPAPAFVLSAGKGKPNLKDSDGSGKSGCDPQQQTPTPGTVPYILVSCHAMTTADFATALHNMAGGYLSSPVVDSTGLTGTYDFDLKWTARGNLARAGDNGITIFQAVDKQLGLHLELQKAPQPVLMVDSANEQPTPNSPEVAKELPPPPPAEFDVAVIRPSAPDKKQLQGRISGGQLDVQGATLKFLVQFAWELNQLDDQQLVGAPKWLDSDHWDIVAKANIEAGPNAPQIEQVDLEHMVQKLLAGRFHLVAHLEDRPISAYTLVADKPKMTKADPSNRTRCKEGPGPDAKDPRISNPILKRLITCQNMTTSQFASMLQSLANGYIYSPVKDATALEGGWDFTLSFSSIGNYQSGPATIPTAGGASDPTGAVPLPDAISKQLGLKLIKETRPAPVLVIEHIDEQPTDN
jgi:uncharacterized protein (TIGR03435 family)